MTSPERNIELTSSEISELKTVLTSNIHGLYYQYCDILVLQGVAIGHYLLKIWKKDSAKHSKFSFMHHIYQIDEKGFPERMHAYSKQLSDLGWRIRIQEGILVDRIKLDGEFDKQIIDISYTPSFWQEYFIGIKGFEKGFEVDLVEKKGCYFLKNYFANYFTDWINRKGIKVNSKLYFDILNAYRWPSTLESLIVNNGQIKLSAIRSYREDNDDDLNVDQYSHFDSFDDNPQIKGSEMWSQL